MKETVTPLTYSIKQAAAVLGVSPQHVRNICNAGKLPCIRFGQRVLIPRSEVERLLRAAA